MLGPFNYPVTDRLLTRVEQVEQLPPPLGQLPAEGAVRSHQSGVAARG